ncbi:WYL domain-containing protein [Streptomyces griseus]|uniref:WYL domain-containing protein n=1 Tax=Streptomyces griseus TaxID=1911 RepID=UPI0037A02A58
MNTMKRTAGQTSTRTLADLIRAMDGQRAVTITYRDSDSDSEESVRTIEIHGIRTTSKGRIVIHAMCRMRGEKRTFHPERIVSYTVHRGIRFVLEAPSAEAPHAHAARSEAEFILVELERDYPVAPLELAA